MARDTSVEAYREILRTGDAALQRERVFLAIAEQQPVTRLELATRTGVPINAVCGRVNELIKHHVVAELGQRTCSVSGRSAYPLVVELEPKQLDLV